MGILQGKNAIVTGSRRGIGRATVEVFAKNGANIWACARKQDSSFEDDMKKIASNYSVSIWPVYFDVANEAEMKAAVQQIRQQKMSIDALINVAGIADESTSFAMTTMEKMHHVLDINFYAVTLLTQYISRLMMRQNSGSIINISSIAGIDGTPAQYEYAASKAALIGGTRNLARELSNYNIRVNCIAPGVIDTDMGGKIEENLKNEVLSKIIMKRFGKPEEIANVSAFLASDMASYMTGQIIRVDGGM